MSSFFSFVGMNSSGTLLGQNGLLKISLLGSILLALALSSVSASPLSTLAQQHGTGDLIEDPGQGEFLLDYLFMIGDGERKALIRPNSTTG